MKFRAPHGSPIRRPLPLNGLKGFDSDLPGLLSASPKRASWSRSSRSGRALFGLVLVRGRFVTTTVRPLRRAPATALGLGSVLTALDNPAGSFKRRPRPPNAPVDEPPLSERPRPANARKSSALFVCCNRCQSPLQVIWPAHRVFRQMLVLVLIRAVLSALALWRRASVSSGLPTAHKKERERVGSTLTFLWHLQTLNVSVE